MQQGPTTPTKLDDIDDALPAHLIQGEPLGDFPSMQFTNISAIGLMNRFNNFLQTHPMAISAATIVTGAAALTAGTYDPSLPFRYVPGTFAVAMAEVTGVVYLGNKLGRKLEELGAKIYDLVQTQLGKRKQSDRDEDKEKDEEEVGLKSRKRRRIEKEAFNEALFAACDAAEEFYHANTAEEEVYFTLEDQFKKLQEEFAQIAEWEAASLASQESGEKEVQEPQPLFFFNESAEESSQPEFKRPDAVSSKGTLTSARQARNSRNN